MKFNRKMGVLVKCNWGCLLVDACSFFLLRIIFQVIFRKFVFRFNF
jgi:hypothetical protein